MKKITIFTCIGGHSIVSQALKEYLAPSHEVSCSNIFLDVLYPVDFLYRISGGKYSAETLYSIALKNKWHFIANKVLDWFAYPFFALCRKKMYKLIFHYIKQQNPDLIISTIPFFNAHFLETARQLNIPFILIPTDVDLATFLHNVPSFNYEQFYIGLSLTNQQTYESLHRLQIPSSHIYQTGAVLKAPFFQSQNITALKSQFNIPPNKPVILLVMGSQGSSCLYKFAQELAKINSIPFHVIMLVGHNIHQKTALAQIQFPAQVTISIFGFTPFVCELMALSDLLITKSGGISVSEAVYMNLPMIVDATSKVLSWEEMNQAFVVDNGFGQKIYTIHDLPQMVTQLLTQRARLDYYKHNLERFPKQNGSQEVKKLVDQLLSTVPVRAAL